MKIVLLTFAAAAVLVLSGFRSTLLAQGSNPLEPGDTKKAIYPGITIGYTQSNHTANISSFLPDKDKCPNFSSGSASGFFAGVNYEHFFGEPDKTNSSLVLRVLYSTYPASFTVTGDHMPSAVYYPGKTEPVTEYTTTDNRLEVVYSGVTVDAFYKIMFFKSDFGGLGAYIGPTMDYILTETLDQTMNLIEPQNAQFKKDPSMEYTNNNRTIVLRKGKIPESSSMRFGVKVSLLYEFFTKNGLIIVPHVTYNLGLTRLTTVENWRVDAFQIALDIRYGFSF
ncbi:MAG: hypothetical protein NT007_15265 [Candidatus Kapabacteria bacterium]|nr:hypothetical protein [Candidatus Kapabacteria bacterium]